ncbi:hypothetical protein FBU30_004661 [Linnemannia zychae]|nr:hypothetical protein FBU30_004661 [Linnemannia zychae]
MSTTPYTIIPSSQPSCGDITTSQPIPHCPNTLLNATIIPDNPNVAPANQSMGCFFQSNGLFCAPLSTTRGFLYRPDSSPDPTQPRRPVVLIPTLSIPTNNNLTNPSPPILGVDGQPVNYRAPSRLGETCYPIPLPPVTDPLFQTLLTIANQQLNETLGLGTTPGSGAIPAADGGGRGRGRAPGVGAGVQVFNFRGDCEQGSYCDFIPSTNATVGMTAGICKEILPNFHSCTSYAQCSSLRCDYLESWSETGGQGSRNTTGDNTSMTVCLPSKLDWSGINNDGGGGKWYKNDSGFPAWIGGIIAIVVVFGVAIIFGLVRRKKKLAADKLKMSLKQRRRSIRSHTAVNDTNNKDRDWNEQRSASLAAHSHHLDQEYYHRSNEEANEGKKSDCIYQVHSSEPSLINGENQISEKNSGNGIEFDGLFRENQTREQADNKADSAKPNSSYNIDHSSVISIGEKEAEPSVEGSQTGPFTREANVTSNEAAAQDSFTSPRSCLSVNIPRITTTPFDPVSTMADMTPLPTAYAEGEERDLAVGLTHSPKKNINSRPSFSSATSSLDVSNDSFLSDLSRRSSNHAFLAATSSTSTPPPGSPVSPISPISPRPSSSSSPSSRSSQRMSMQQQSSTRKT